MSDRKGWLSLRGVRICRANSFRALVFAAPVFIAAICGVSSYLVPYASAEPDPSQLYNEQVNKSIDEVKKRGFDSAQVDQIRRSATDAQNSDQMKITAQKVREVQKDLAPPQPELPPELPMGLPSGPNSEAQLRDMLAGLTKGGGSQVRSKQIQGMLEEMKRRRADLQSVASGRASHIDLTITRHLRALDKGIPLPSRNQVRAVEESIPNKYPGVVTVDRRQLRQMAAAINLEREIDYSTPLPDCSESKTVKVPYARRNPNVAADRLFLDKLHQRKGNLPLDYKEYYGKTIVVSPYLPPDQDKGKAHFFATLDNVECLPKRVRVTAEAQYIHYGKDALLNYDKNPNGPGVEYGNEPVQR